MTIFSRTTENILLRGLNTRVKLIPITSGLIALIVYTVTLVREPVWGDSAELSLAAYNLGVTHSPGYPVHSMLGKLLMLIVHEPAIATNLLSALGASLSVMIISHLILQWTNNPLIALLAPIQFAVAKPIWDMAVVTEVYDVNLAFVGLLILFTLAWWQNSSMLRLVKVAVLYGIAIGAFLANVFIAPAFLPMLWKEPRGRWLRLFLFAMIVGVLVLAMLGFSMWRSHTVPPLGTPYPPTSFANAFKFFTGYEVSPFVVKTSTFYLQRTLQLVAFFPQNFLYIGILPGLWGFVVQWRKQRDLAIFLGLMFLCNILFFSYYQGVDFQLETIQSYLVFALWIGLGIDDLMQRIKIASLSPMILGGLFLTLLIAGQLYLQLPEKLSRASSDEVTKFNVDSLQHFPENAVVVGLWERYTTLKYFQTVHDLRPDVLLVERKGNMSSLVTTYAGDRPILFDARDAIPGMNPKRFYLRWFLLQP